MLLTWHTQVCFLFHEYIKNQAIARYGKLSKKVARDNRHLNRYPNVVPCEFLTSKQGMIKYSHNAIFWNFQKNRNGMVLGIFSPKLPCGKNIYNVPGYTQRTTITIWVYTYTHLFAHVIMVLKASMVLNF